MLWDNGVHQLVGTQDSIGRTGLYAQRAADTPVFIYQCQCARAFCAVCLVEWTHCLPGNGSQTGNALRAARWALVYARFAHSHRLRVMGAVRVAAARALRLRQNSINACC
jgi:hypothetical protein